MSIISDHAHDSHDMGGSCKACGTDWIDHMGIQSTCSRLQQASELLLMALSYIKQPEYSRDLGEQEMYFDFRKAVEKFYGKH
jgi:hypothetical protein